MFQNVINCKGDTVEGGESCDAILIGSLDLGGGCGGLPPRLT